METYGLQTANGTSLPKVWAHSQLRDPFHSNNTVQPWVHELQTSFLYFIILCTSTAAFIWWVEKVLMNISYDFSKCRRHCKNWEHIQTLSHTGFSSEMILTQKQKVQCCARKNLKRFRKKISLLSETWCLQVWSHRSLPVYLFTIV